MDYCRYRYKRKKRKGSRTVVLLLVCAVLIFCLNLYLAKCVNPQVFKAVSSQISSDANRLINTAAQSVILENPQFETLSTVHMSDTNRVTLVEYNHMYINLFALRTTSEFIKLMETAGSEGISVPIGSFSGIPILSASGAKVNIKYQPITAASCEVVSQFTAAGINQTLHRISFKLSAQVNSLVPASEVVSIVSEVLVYEAVIVGEVPSVLFGTQSIGSVKV